MVCVKYSVHFHATFKIFNCFFFSSFFCMCFSFTKGEIVLHLSAFFEVLISAIITLLIYEPYWSLKIHSCSVSRLSDWYTLFHNPTPNYEKKLYCTQEAVYPLLVDFENHFCHKHCRRITFNCVQLVRLVSGKQWS